MPVPLTIRRILSVYPIDLPVFHPIAMKLQHLLCKPDFTIDEVIELADQDQALAAKILRIANSPVYRGSESVATIREAVVRLGAQPVSNIAMAASQAGLHSSENETINRYMRKLWQHSHSTAIGCRWVAVTAGFARIADQAYLAGLLHDIGKLYLLKVLEKLNKSGVARSALEDRTLRDVFVELHVEQGKALMEHWDMPGIYCDVVARHHDEQCPVDDPVLMIVRLVNGVCSKAGLSLNPDPRLGLGGFKEIDLLGLSVAKVVALENVLYEARVFPI